MIEIALSLSATILVAVGIAYIIAEAME